MFESRKTKIFNQKEKTNKETSVKSTMTIPDNPFLREGLKDSFRTTETGNGALKLTTTGSSFVDDYSSVSNYKNPRSYAEVSKTMTEEWSQDKHLTIAMILYIRAITRTVVLPDGSKTEETQRGQGLRHESILRLIWLAINAPDIFWKNVHLFISAGSWKDIIMMMSYDIQYNGWNDRKLNWDKFGKLILAGLENPMSSELLKKYLPKAEWNNKKTPNEKNLHSQADALIGKFLIGKLYPKYIGAEDMVKAQFYKLYRKLKSKGTAHQWQQLISQGKHNLIDFETIHGRALAKLVSGKYLKNQNLEEKYGKYIASKPVLKYTGYVYELFAPLGNKSEMKSDKLPNYKIETINKQFLSLVEIARKDMREDNVGSIVIRDTSGSMEGKVRGTNYSSLAISKGLALFASHLLKGRFNGCYLEFSDETIMKQWIGSTPVEQMCYDNSSITAGTNFLSVADHFGKILKEGVKESEFPKMLICFSDLCFNIADNNKSNFRSLLDRLIQKGFSKEFVADFKVVLWDIPNEYYSEKPEPVFEEFADTPNLFHISGLDASSLAFLTGTKRTKSSPKNSDELMLAALGQEMMGMIEL